MARFYEYKVISADGSVVTGESQADSVKVVYDQLVSRGFSVVSVEPKRKSGFKFDLSSIDRLFQKPIKDDDLATFTTLFGTMLKAGVPLTEGLDVIVAQTENPRFQQILSEVKSSIQGGEMLSEAFGRHPKVFGTLFLALVKVGEIGGGLPENLLYLAGILESQKELNQKIKNAMVYPAIMATVAIVIVTFLLTFIIPSFVEIFTDAGVDLPGLTLALLATSGFLTSYWYFILPGVILFVVGLRVLVRSDRGEYYWHMLQLRLPLVGDLVRKLNIARFSRTYGSLLSRGVPLVETLDVVATVVGNRIIREVIWKVQRQIKQGRSFSEPLAESKEIPPMVVQMFSVGEESGSLDEMALEVAEYYDREVSHEVTRLTTVLEPLLIIVMGLIVSTMIMACLLPMFDMMAVARA
ncbi:type II secretion system F family protein [Gemmatimonadota bacterium]